MNGAYVLLIILAATLFLFAWERWRYDVVAIMALLTSVILGVVPFHSAFSGFSNPAVVTVGCIMVISAAIGRSGVVDYAVARLAPVTRHPVWHVAALSLLAAILSAFMNNVGALGLLMPVAIQTAIKSKESPSTVLMPVAFASILGGMTTLIGTPPNILISGFRAQTIGTAYSMFAFSPVGTVVTVVGILFIAFIGWRLIPARKTAKQIQDIFEVQDYITEIKIPADSPYVEKTLRELEKKVEADFIIAGLIRKKQKRLVIQPSEPLQKNDILIVEASHADLEKLVHAGKFELVEGKKDRTTGLLSSEDIILVEAVVSPGARIEGHSSQSIRMRSRYSLNLLAIAREGMALRKRLKDVILRAGDVVLLQGEEETIHENLSNFGLLPLVERGVQVGMRPGAFRAAIIFFAAIVLAVTNLLPIEIAFAAGVLALVLFNVLPVRRVYESVEWPVIILLGAMIPIGMALQTTGGTDLIAKWFLLVPHAHPMYVLGAVMLVTMTLSALMNNAATAVVMAPIALSIADSMHVSVDPLLMAVAVGASASFMTPIAHQNNTIVMGPGGYKFMDFVRMGLPLQIIVLLVGVPMIMWVWPF